jgi:hypothetical protein
MCVVDNTGMRERERERDIHPISHLFLDETHMRKAIRASM